MRQIVIALLCCVSALAPLPARAADPLKVIVVDGDEAANIVAERLASVPVVEVRDKDDRRVPGAVVRFLIRKARNRLIATFRNGQAEVRTITDAAGQANSSTIVPLEPGSFEIEVEVSYPGQTGRATIRQTNFRTVADAKAAGREPGKSTSSSAQTSVTGASSAATGAAAATASATVPLPPVAAAAGGGVSKVAVVGLVAGGAAGAGAAVVLSQRKSDPPPATVSPITASQTVGIYTATIFTFSAQATNFEASSLTYRWEFGDGGTSTDPAPTHVYDAPGPYTVVVTVRDARQSARSEMAVTILGLTGNWVSQTGRTNVQLTQSASAIAGSGTLTGISPTGAEVSYPGCAMAGTIERGATVPVIIDIPDCRHPQLPNVLIGGRLNLTVAPDGRTMSGVSTTPGRPDQAVTMTRQ